MVWSDRAVGNNASDRATSSRNKKRESRSIAMSRRAFLGTGSAGVGLALAGCLSDSQDETEVSYRHRFSRSLSSAINDAGVELGAWEEEGLDVEFGTSSGGQEAAQAVANGQDDFTNPEIGVTLQLIEEGAPLTILAHIINPLGGVVSLAENDITDWTDLEGAEVGVFPWAVSGDLALEAMREQGGDPDTVELRNMDPGQQETLLMAGEVDAVVAYYPQSVTRLEHEGYETNALVTSDVLDHLGNVLVTREEMVEDNPDVVDSFVRGWLKAHEMYITDVDSVIEIHKEKVSTFDEEVERRTLPALHASRLHTEVDLEHGMGWVPETELENTISVFEEIDFLEPTKSIEEYYTNQFIEDNQELALEVANLYHDTLTESDGVGPDYV